MAKCDIGRTIIDELRLCYTAEQTLLQELSQIEMGKWKDYENFSLFRVHSHHFQYSYDILHNRTKVATLRFGHYGEPQQTSYVYYRIENQILYNHDMLTTILTLPDILGFTFQHITSLDLAQDYTFNIVQRIRKIAKEPNTKVIINGNQQDTRHKWSNDDLHTQLYKSSQSFHLSQTSKSRTRQNKRTNLMCIQQKKRNRNRIPQRLHTRLLRKPQKFT